MWACLVGIESVGVSLYTVLHPLIFVVSKCCKHVRWALCGYVHPERLSHVRQSAEWHVSGVLDTEVTITRDY